MQELKTYGLAWGAMMLLLALTYGLSFVLTGATAAVANLSIAFIKAALVYWFFMHGRRESGIVRLSGLVGGVWLMVLFMLVFSDYLTRSWS